jgi:hypothetical protein
METPEAYQEDHAHHKHSVKKQVFVSFFVVTFLILATILVILYGKGYRLNLKPGEQKISKTGILQATSKPTGAQVYINDELETATDNAINLSPGKYTVKITKDGYNDWQKDIQIEREVVSNADALLLPRAPTLQSISTFNVESATADPTGTRLAFKIGSSSAKRNGIYVFDMTGIGFPVLAGQGNDTQLVDDSLAPFSTADITWSPDGKQILAKIETVSGVATYYLLTTDNRNTTPQNVTNTLSTILNEWETLRLDKENARLKSLKSPVQKFARENFRVLAWSPDENKILYQASNSAQIPVFRKPRIIGNNLLYERRDLKKNAIYVYDMKEDVNTRIIDSTDLICIFGMPDCTQDDKNSIVPFTWFPDSNHIIYVHDKKIDIVEDDGSNMTTIYAGPFLDHYVFPWPDGSKIVILTNLGNTNISPTLYTIGLK